MIDRRIQESASLIRCPKCGGTTTVYGERERLMFVQCWSCDNADERRVGARLRARTNLPKNMKKIKAETFIKIAKISHPPQNRGD